MRNLILVRHAKSSWNLPLQDKDRPLDQRGVSDAHLVAKIFVNTKPSNPALFCSSAQRTTETALIFAANNIYQKENIVFRDDLYTFDENKLEKVIKSIANSFENVILFGHNEAITNFVNKFGDIFIENVPTCGLVWLQFSTNSWNTIEKGKTIKTIFPRDLK